MLMMQWWADSSPNAICQLDLGFNTASHIHVLCLHALSNVYPADSLQTLLACFNLMVYFVVHYSFSVKGFYLQCYSWSASVLLRELSRMRQTVDKKNHSDHWKEVWEVTVFTLKTYFLHLSLKPRLKRKNRDLNTLLPPLGIGGKSTQCNWNVYGKISAYIVLQPLLVQVLLGHFFKTTSWSHK